MASHERRVWDASRGVLQPSARQKVSPAIYDELDMSPTTDGVIFDEVAVLTALHVSNDSATGTIIVPTGTAPVRLGGSLVNVRYWSWEQICRRFGA